MGMSALPVWIYSIFTPGCLWRPEKDVVSAGTGVTDGSELLCRFCKQNLHLQELEVLLTIELFLQSQQPNFKEEADCWVDSWWNEWMDVWLFLIIIPQRSSSLKTFIDLFSQCCSNLSSVAMRKYVYLYLPLISSATKNSTGFAHCPFICILMDASLAKVPKMLPRYLYFVHQVCMCVVFCLMCNGRKSPVCCSSFSFSSMCFVNCGTKLLP